VDTRPDVDLHLLETGVPLRVGERDGAAIRDESRYVGLVVGQVAAQRRPKPVGRDD
jgi:hypothetical protein